MTYDANIPNAAQSPGLFPTQNNTNFARLKTIINADHVFNDTAQSTDGIHRQVTGVARAMPVALPMGSNSILYSWIDSLSRTQLRFYNGITDVQLTPPQELYPIKILGTLSVAANTTTTAYADPGFLWSGTGWAMIQNQSVFRFYNLLRQGSNDAHELDNNSGSISRPTFSFSGNNLMITNNDSSTRTLVWSLIINRNS